MPKQFRTTYGWAGGSSQSRASRIKQQDAYMKRPRTPSTKEPMLGKKSSLGGIEKMSPKIWGGKVDRKAARAALDQFKAAKKVSAKEARLNRQVERMVNRKVESAYPDITYDKKSNTFGSKSGDLGAAMDAAHRKANRDASLVVARNRSAARGEYEKYLNKQLQSKGVTKSAAKAALRSRGETAQSLREWRKGESTLTSHMKGYGISRSGYAVNQAHNEALTEEFNRKSKSGGTLSGGESHPGKSGLVSGALKDLSIGDEVVSGLYGGAKGIVKANHPARAPGYHVIDFEGGGRTSGHGSMMVQKRVPKGSPDGGQWTK